MANPDGVKYPEVNVQLVGLDGNAFSILGRAQKAAKRAGLTAEQIEEYQNEATNGDYNHLLQTTMLYFETIGGDDGWDEDEEWDEEDED